jgi:hypothetical protein
MRSPLVSISFPRVAGGRGGGGDAAVGATAGRGGRAAGCVGGGSLAEGPPPDARGGAGALQAASARPGARRVLRADTGVAGVARHGLTPHGAYRSRRGPLHQAPHDGIPPCPRPFSSTWFILARVVFCCNCNYCVFP